MAPAVLSDLCFRVKGLGPHYSEHSLDVEWWLKAESRKSGSSVGVGMVVQLLALVSLPPLDATRSRREQSPAQPAARFPCRISLCSES